MQYVVHEVNNLEKLNRIDYDCGIEVDIRFRDGNLVVGHDLNELNLNFTDWLDAYGHKLLVANIKDSGIDVNNVDFFNIDIEGLDKIVLQNNNWDEFSPKVIAFEDHLFNIEDINNCETLIYLMSKGYKFIAKCGPTIIVKLT